MKLLSVPFAVMVVFFMSGCSDPVITERGHNADWNDGYESAESDLKEKQEECVTSLNGEIRHHPERLKKRCAPLCFKRP